MFLYALDYSIILTTVHKRQTLAKVFSISRSTHKVSCAVRSAQKFDF
jgi:hypothetical protein